MKSVADSPVQFSAMLGRRIRTDDPETVGISTQTLAEQALDCGGFDVAADLGEYFHDEIARMNSALHTWLVEILAYRAGREGISGTGVYAESERTIAAFADFDPGAGDLQAFLIACEQCDHTSAASRLELMRVRSAVVHDHLVVFIQGLLTQLAERHGDDAVLEVVLLTYDQLWSARYDTWEAMSALERLQLSVEGMRGHLSGPRRRGDVDVTDESNRFIMSLDPCGSCGILRRGDPDSGRVSVRPAGTTDPHAWSWDRVGVGWYAVHSAIVMEWLQISKGQPPLRPLADCDTDLPCRWFIYKKPAEAHSEQLAGSFP